MKALETFRKHIKEKSEVYPPVPTVPSAVGTLQATDLAAVTSVPAVPSEKDIVEGEKKINVFNFRVTDSPKSILTVIAHSLSLDEAIEMLVNKYGDRLIEVTKK